MGPSRLPRQLNEMVRQMTDSQTGRPNDLICKIGSLAPNHIQSIGKVAMVSQASSPWLSLARRSGRNQALPGPALLLPYVWKG